MLPDGRVQRVRYTVEGPDGGFKAVVSYEGKTRLAEPKTPRPQRPKNMFPAVRKGFQKPENSADVIYGSPLRVKKPSFGRAALRTLHSHPTYAGSTPGPTLAPQFSQPQPKVVKFQRESEPKWKRYSYKTLPDPLPSVKRYFFEKVSEENEVPPEPAGLVPSSGVTPTLRGRQLTTEKTSRNDSSELRNEVPPPTPFASAYGPPGFQDPLPRRTFSNYRKNPPPGVVRRLKYRPLEAEEDDTHDREEAEEEEDEEEGFDDDYDEGDDDNNETSNKIPSDHLEVRRPLAMGASSTPPRRSHPSQKEPFRDSEIITLSPSHYSLSSPYYRPLHHPYALNDQLYPLPSVRRYSFREVPNEDESEGEVPNEDMSEGEVPNEDKDDTLAGVDTEDDGAEQVPVLSGEEKEADLVYKVKRIGDAAAEPDELDPDETRESRTERKEIDNDNIHMTISEDLVLPESEIWGYRYLP